MYIRLKRTSVTPLFSQIAGSIRADVQQGRLSPGAKLPPGRLLAEALNVNTHTVLRAYQLLRDEGVVELRRGRGAIVIEPIDPMVAVHQALDTATSVAVRGGVRRQTLHGLLISLCNEKGVPK